MTDAEGTHVRVHYGLSGSVPLQLFEFVFESRGCYVLDCGAFTPLFGLARGKHTQRAGAIESVYETHGLDGLLAIADSVTWLPWESIERVTLYTGGWLARPKLTVTTTVDVTVRPVRLHGVDVDRTHGALAALVAESAVTGDTVVERIDGIGLRGRG